MLTRGTWEKHVLWAFLSGSLGCRVRRANAASALGGLRALAMLLKMIGKYAKVSNRQQEIMDPWSVTLLKGIKQQGSDIEL